MEPAPTGALTFLLTDIEGSTRLWELHPEAMKDALRRHDAILRAAIETSAGQVVKTTGDGMMAVFGSAVRATEASLAAQLDLQAEGWTETGPLRVRMGIHCGLAEQRGGDYFGPTLNRTARIMAAGHGGQVLLSESAGALAREALPAGATLIDLGEHRLKDLGRPEHLFQLVHPDLASDFPPLLTVREAGVDLPARAAGLIGRHDELAVIRERLADGSVRLLTLIGPGGTGKTTLAIKVAEDVGAGFTDGACFVDLAAARDTYAVLVAIARTIGLGEIIDRPLEDELVDRLRDRQMLLVLDNFEQVAEAATFVARLLSECPRLTVLATSRQALNVRAERLYQVPPLGIPPAEHGAPSARVVSGYEAVQLFVDRARGVRPDFELTDENAAAVVEICRRLDGLPLAIELAAAHLRLLSPEVLRDRLGNRLRLLRSGPRDLPERQQTLRATMDWSYDLLEPGEQRLFALLAVFADADLAAVEAVADATGTTDDDPGDVLAGLAGLAEKSLIRLVDQPNGEPRVSMLETIREFATDRLDSEPEIAARARLSHATHFTELARRTRPELNGGGRDAALARLAGEVANLRIAWAWWVEQRDLERLEQLAGPLLILDDARGWYLDTVVLTRDMLAVLAAAPATPDRVGQEIALRTSLARALMATKGFTPEVDAVFASVVELFERGGDARQHYSVLRGMASLYMFRAQLDETVRLGRQILALGEREGDPGMLIDGHLLVGAMLMSLDDLHGGLDHLDQAIALFPTQASRAATARVGNDPRISCLTTSALTLWMLGYPDRAVERADAALALAAKLDHPFTTAYAQFHAGLLHLWLRDSEAALELATRLLDQAEEYGFRIWTAAGTCLQGAAQVDLRRFEDGLANIRAGMDLYGELRSPPIFWPFLLFLTAHASLRAGRPADGLPPIDTAIGILSQGSTASILSEFELVKGDLLAALAAGQASGQASGAETSPETWYRRAYDRATQLDARTTLLRAATRLARLRLAEGHPDEAELVLRPIYQGFDEGFETTDLREARDLLAGLGVGA